jgi:hypothetical protein
MLKHHASEGRAEIKPQFPNGIVSSVSFESTTNTARSLAGFVLLALALTPWRSPGSSEKAEGGSRHVGGAGIGGHDQDHMAEVDLLAAVVGQLAVICVRFWSRHLPPCGVGGRLPPRYMRMSALCGISSTDEDRAQRIVNLVARLARSQ